MKRDDLFESLSPTYEGIAEYYDLFADSSDIPFYLKMAETSGSPVLDLAAGTCRVALPLAEAGHKVVALESSPSMLEVARKRLVSATQGTRKRLTIIEGDMRDFNLKRKFALIIIPNSFGHALTTDSQVSTLKCVRKHLANDGVFGLDFFPGALQHEHASFEDRPAPLPGGSTVSRKGELRMDPLRQLVRLDLTYTVRDSRGDIVAQTDIVSGAAVIFNREADLLVRTAGLEVVSEYGGFDFVPYQPASSRRILVLRRRRREGRG